MAETVKVAVRLRPFNQLENDNKRKRIVTMNGGMTSIRNPADNSVKDFSFDFCWDSFDPKDAAYADQSRVFKDVGIMYLDNAWNGYNCSLFAYGQTGSGKSYSMMGYGEAKGIIPLGCQEMFKRIAANSDAGLSYQVEISYLEIYNEKVRDLLNPGKAGEDLKIREHPTLGVYVDQLRKQAVSKYTDIEAAMDAGNKIRTVAATKMNATSSRSHSVFTVYLKQVKPPAAAGGKPSEKTSKINLIDLAGSERQEKTGAEGVRLQEACAINKSLSSLGNVISALSEGKAFVPYRDSVLTRLLEDALGGNSKTIMIAALSPADNNFDETFSTLKYAERAKKIMNKATVNESASDKMLKELQGTISDLRKKLAAYEAAGVAPAGVVATDGSAAAAPATTASADGSAAPADAPASPAAVNTVVVADQAAIEAARQSALLEAEQQKQAALEAERQTALAEQQRVLAAAEEKAAAEKKAAKAEAEAAQKAALEAAQKEFASAAEKEKAEAAAKEAVARAEASKAAAAAHQAELAQQRAKLQADADAKAAEASKQMEAIRAQQAAVAEDARKAKEAAEAAHKQAEEKRLKLEEQIAAMERLQKDATSSFDSKLKEANALKAEREAALEDMGISLSEMNSGSKAPQLINLSPDPMLSGAMVYFLKEGTSVFGTSKESNVVIGGVGLLPKHCTIVVKGNQVTVTPEGDAKVYISGKQVHAATQLTQGDRVILGQSYIFRFNDPTQAQAAAFDWDQAMKEFATARGRIEKPSPLLLAAEMADEMTDIAEAQGKRAVFSVDIANDASRAIRIRMTSLGSGKFSLWDMGTAETMLEQMRQNLVAWQENPSFSVPREQDPFYAAPADTEIGKGVLSLAELAHKGVVEKTVKLGGKHGAEVEIEVFVSQDRFSHRAKNMQELVGKSAAVTIRISKVSHIPKESQAGVFVKFDFPAGGDMEVTPRAEKVGSEVTLNYKETFVLTLTPEVLASWASLEIPIEVWGHELAMDTAQLAADYDKLLQSMAELRAENSSLDKQLAERKAEIERLKNQPKQSSSCTLL
eukprot:TRINITY_DN5557_c0_g3_i1.p1 TRINITY_DN5557_c0_g3~~TRINITY_DN5557_c0_g3_i1.p1  ORF type:complete len:1046 (+),score=367.13 TRINITY_DN5557_c0_g3_i1:88-3225(+)